MFRKVYSGPGVKRDGPDVVFEPNYQDIQWNACAVLYTRDQELLTRLAPYIQLLSKDPQIMENIHIDSLWAKLLERAAASKADWIQEELDREKREKLEKFSLRKQQEYV